MREIGKVEPGLFTFKFVKGGAEFPVRIAKEVARDPVTGEPLDRSPVLVGYVGDVALPITVGKRTFDLDSVWPYLREVSEKRYRYLLDRARWCARYRPGDPAVNPLKPAATARRAVAPI